MPGEAEPPSDEFSDEDVIASILENIATYPPSKRKKVIKYLEKRGAHGAAEAVRSLPPTRSTPSRREARVAPPDSSIEKEGRLWSWIRPRPEFLRPGQ